jgi:hypothetical protein
LFGVIPALVEVLQNVCCGFLRGFRSTGRSCVCDALPNYRCGSFPNLPNQPINYRRDDVCSSPKDTPNRQGFSSTDQGTELCSPVTFFLGSAELAGSFASFASTSTDTERARA